MNKLTPEQIETVCRELSHRRSTEEARIYHRDAVKETHFLGLRNDLDAIITPLRTP